MVAKFYSSISTPDLNCTLILPSSMLMHSMRRPTRASSKSVISGCCFCRKRMAIWIFFLVSFCLARLVCAACFCSFKQYISSALNTLADAVIRGDYGNGQERRRRPAGHRRLLSPIRRNPWQSPRSDRRGLKRRSLYGSLSVPRAFAHRRPSQRYHAHSRSHRN